MQFEWKKDLIREKESGEKKALKRVGVRVYSPPDSFEGPTYWLDGGLNPSAHTPDIVNWAL